MNETSKSALRRSHDPAFIQHYFVGEGLDIGAGEDPLAAHTHLFPRARRIQSWGEQQGDVVQMKGAHDGSFDFVHASHVLAEVTNPGKALARWLDLLKPGGYAVLTLPDEDLYGKGAWPNRFNKRHKSSFTICKPEKQLAQSINILDLIQTLSHVASCERVSLVRDHYDEARNDADQTARGLAECAIEVVLRKRAVPTAQNMLDAIVKARSAEASIDAGRRAVKTYPYRFMVYHRSMMEWLRWDREDEVDRILEQCVVRLPNEHLPRLYRALHAISRGKLHHGFRLREAAMASFGWQRRTTAQPPATFPEWKGESLEGKSIVIWSEFGLGDEIFFLRFARMLRERCGAARVTVMCQTPLVSLFEVSREADAVIDVKHAAQLPAHDCWVFPHAIPAHLPLELDALPVSVPFLRAPSDEAPALLRTESHALKVGVVFKGAPTHENDHARSLPSLSVLDELFQLEGVEFFSLQKGAGADEAAQYAQRLSNFHDLGADIRSMDETASAIAALDLVLTVDTSVAHVAGAMGKPTWLMLPSYGDWRWHYTREDSPWYPTMRLFRRRFDGNWPEVVARIRGHLLTLIASNLDSAGSSALPAPAISR
jgi:SAM-dependent methyltransferase